MGRWLWVIVGLVCLVVFFVCCCLPTAAVILTYNQWG
jgi:hypothetical protein